MKLVFFLLKPFSRGFIGLEDLIFNYICPVWWPFGSYPSIFNCYITCKKIFTSICRYSKHTISPSPDTSFFARKATYDPSKIWDKTVTTDPHRCEPLTVHLQKHTWNLDQKEKKTRAASLGEMTPVFFAFFPLTIMICSWEKAIFINVSSFLLQA